MQLEIAKLSSRHSAKGHWELMNFLAFYPKRCGGIKYLRLVQAET